MVLGLAALQLQSLMMNRHEAELLPQFACTINQSQQMFILSFFIKYLEIY